MAFDQVAYNNEYNKRAYEEIKIRVPKGKKNLLKEYAKKTGKSVNAIFIESVEAQHGIDLSKD